MRNKLVKLLYSNYKDHYNINKKERKAKVNQCKQLQILFEKC